PFPGKTQAEVRQLQLTRMPPPPSVARTESRLSRALDAAVLWALTLDPAARCKRIEDFLSAFQVGYDRTLVEQMHPQEARRPGSRRVVLVVAAAVTLLGGAAAVGYVATRDPGAVAPPPRHGTAAAPNSPPDAAAPLSAKEARAEARRQLEEALRSTDALLKQSALEYLRRVARQPGPAVVARVREAIQDANPLTAINAIRAAGELGDKEAIPELSALLAQSIGPKRIATAEALAQLGHKAGVEQLRKEVSSDGLFARARQGDIEARGGLKRMLASLDSIGADPGQRVTSASYRALGYLTSLGDAKATEAFERVLRGASCEAIVEMAQALLLATPDRKDVREALVGCLDEGGGKGRSRLKAALQLAQIRDARAVDPLVQFVESSQELELRRDAILGLGRVGGERARSAVVTSLKSPDALTRLAAAVALFEP
ncbi:MAG: HEAT repeat domain-containing protein, partial [Acidobacteriota bacterium]